MKDWLTQHLIRGISSLHSWWYFGPCRRRNLNIPFLSQAFNKGGISVEDTKCCNLQYPIFLMNQ